MKRLLITGSRTFTNKSLIAEAINAIVSDTPQNWILVSGGCPSGADFLCEHYARQIGMQIERHPADWKQFGKSAGFKRNNYMVSLGADAGIAFLMPCSKPNCITITPHSSHGAWYTTEEMFKNNITPVLLVKGNN